MTRRYTNPRLLYPNSEDRTHVRGISMPELCDMINTNTKTRRITKWVELKKRFGLSRRSGCLIHKSVSSIRVSRVGRVSRVSDMVSVWDSVK